MFANRTLIPIALLVLAALVAMASVFYVDEREKAIVFRFGEIIRTFDEPGLSFKYPIINEVRFFDARIQTLDTPPALFLTSEKKNLVVDSFVKWRILDVERYYVTVGGLITNARARLSQRVNDSLRQEFGKRTVQDVISGDRAQIMEVVRNSINTEAKTIGVEVVDVRLKRVDLDSSISERVYSRMEAERTRVAKDLRAKGSEAAERIRADADRESAVIIAEARRISEEIRGKGEAEATRIYADAYKQDVGFFQFYRRLNAYRKSFNAYQSDMMVLEPDSEFFRFFKNAQ